LVSAINSSSETGTAILQVSATSIAAAVGTVTESASATIAITAVALVGSAGNVTESGGAIIQATPLAIIASVGQVTASASTDVIVAVTGVLVTAIVGSIFVIPANRQLNFRILATIRAANVVVQALISPNSMLAQVQTDMAQIALEAPQVMSDGPLVVSLSTVKLIFLMKALTVVRQALSIVPSLPLRQQEVALYGVYSLLLQQNFTGSAENQGPFPT